MRLLIPTVLLATGAAAGADLPAGANAYCPVTTDEPADERYHAVHEGRTIYFCCGKCRRKFLADPAAYAVDRTPAATTPDGGTSKLAKPAAAWERLGRLHPLAVHFPVALMAAAGLAEVLSVARRQVSWSFAGRYCIVLGATGAALAVPLGWLAAGPPPVDALTEWHRWLGIATFATGAGAALLARTAHRLAYRVLLFGSVALVAATGHLGGALTHGTPIFPLW